MPPGRPKMIQTPEEMWDLFTGYRAYVKTNPIRVQDFVGKDADEVWREKQRPLTMEGFENYVADEGGPWSLEHYFANTGGTYGDFLTVCSRVRKTIREDQIAGGLAGIYNPSITQRLNNLVDRQEIKQTLIPQRVDMSQLSEEALKEIADATGSEPSEG